MKKAVPYAQEGMVGFSLRVVHVGCVGKKSSTGAGFCLENLGFPCQLIPQCSTLICHLRMVQYAYLMQQYQRLTLSLC